MSKTENILSEFLNKYLLWNVYANNSLKRNRCCKYLIPLIDDIRNEAWYVNMVFAFKIPKFQYISNVN